MVHLVHFSLGSLSLSSLNILDLHKLSLLLCTLIVTHFTCFFLAVFEVMFFHLCMQDQVFSENDAFFAWTFVKRRPLWQTLLSFCWPVLTLAICLFPVYPHQVKLLILYSCAGVLLLILSLLLCKFLVLNSFIHKSSDICFIFF